MRWGVIAASIAIGSLFLLPPAGAATGDLGPQSKTSVEIRGGCLSPLDGTSLTLCPNGTFIVANETSSVSVSTGHDLSFSHAAWRPDGSYALIVGEGGTLIKYNLKHGALFVDTGTTENLTSVSWKPDGSFALITGSGGIVIRFDHDSQRCLRIPTNTNLKLKDVQWDTSGEHAEISGEGGTTIIYPPVEERHIGIRITSPAAGSAVAGRFTVSGIASVKGADLARVEAKIDSGGWLPASGGACWELPLDAGPYDNGLHTISARAWSSLYDVALTSVEVRFENIRLPPVVDILAPSDTARIFGIITVEGTAASFSGTVERVDVRLDDFDWGRALGTGFWRLSVDTTTLPNGVHRLQARVWDGAQYSVAGRLLLVENAAPLPAGPARRAVQGTDAVFQPRTEAPSQDFGTSLPPAPLPPSLPAPQAGRPAVAPVKDGGTIVVPAYTWAMLLLAALALGTEPGKYALFQLFFVPLYSRIKKDAVLDNFTRGMIYGFIMSNPGVHYNFIKQRLGLNNGSIVYHLTVLERQELIKSEKVGLYKRFYPMGQTLSETGIMELNETQQAMLELVRREPGLTQHELAGKLGLSSRVVNYHVGLLQRARLVALERDGKVTRCFATERMPVC